MERAHAQHHPAREPKIRAQRVVSTRLPTRGSCRPPPTSRSTLHVVPNTMIVPSSLRRCLTSSACCLRRAVTDSVRNCQGRSSQSDPLLRTGLLPAMRRVFDTPSSLRGMAPTQSPNKPRCQNRAEGRLRTIPILAEITTQLRHLSFRLATALPPPVAWPADSLLLPRLHYELHGDALC